MADITTISAFLTSVKTAADIAKALKNASNSLEKAETKLKIAELIEALADSKMQAAEIQDLIQEKDRKISELEKALELKANLIRSGDAYYETNSGNEPIGDPYCSQCWEVNHVSVHVHRDAVGIGWACPKCKTHYAKHSIKKFPSGVGAT